MVTDDSWDKFADFYSLTCSTVIVMMRGHTGLLCVVTLRCTHHMKMKAVIVA